MTSPNCSKETALRASAAGAIMELQSSPRYRPPSPKSVGGVVDRSNSICTVASSSCSSGCASFEKGTSCKAEPPGTAGQAAPPSPFTRAAQVDGLGREGFEGAAGGQPQAAFLAAGEAAREEDCEATAALLASPLCAETQNAAHGLLLLREAEVEAAAAAAPLPTPFLDPRRRRDCAAIAAAAVAESQTAAAAETAMKMAREMEMGNGSPQTRAEGDREMAAEGSTPLDSLARRQSAESARSKEAAAAATVVSEASAAAEEFEGEGCCGASGGGRAGLLLREGGLLEGGALCADSQPPSPSSPCDETPPSISPHATTAPRRRGRPMRRAAANSMRRLSEDLGAEAAAAAVPSIAARGVAGALNSKCMPGVKFSASRKAYIARWSEESRERWKTFPLKNYKGEQEAFMDATKWRVLKVRERLVKLFKDAPTAPAPSASSSAGARVQSGVLEEAAALECRRAQGPFEGSPTNSLHEQNGGLELEMEEDSAVSLRGATAAEAAAAVLRGRAARSNAGGLSLEDPLVSAAGAEGRSRRSHAELSLQGTDGAEGLGAAEDFQRRAPARRPKRPRAKALSQQPQTAARVCTGGAPAEQLLGEDCVEEQERARMRAAAAADEFACQPLQRLLPRVGARLEEASASMRERERSSEAMFKDAFHLYATDSGVHHQSSARAATATAQSEGWTDTSSAALLVDSLGGRDMARAAADRHLLSREVPRGRPAGTLAERARYCSPTIGAADVGCVRSGDSSRGIVSFHGGPGALDFGRNIKEEHGSLSHPSFGADPLMELRKLLNNLLEDIYRKCIPLIPIEEEKHRYGVAVVRLIRAISETDTSSKLGPLLGLFAGIVRGGEPSQQPREVQVYILNALVQLVSIFGRSEM